MSTSDDGTQRIWDTRTGAQQRVLGADRSMRRAEFSWDGTRIVAGAQDGTVLLWATSGPPTVLCGHEGEVRDVAYSLDGRWLAGTGSDKPVRFWPVDAGQAPVVVRWSGPMASSVTYGSDAQRLVNTHTAGATRLWTCELCAPIDHVRALAGERTERGLA